MPPEWRWKAWEARPPGATQGRQSRFGEHRAFIWEAGGFWHAQISDSFGKVVWRWTALRRHRTHQNARMEAQQAAMGIMSGQKQRNGSLKQ